jgi:hypothetical protein
MNKTVKKITAPQIYVTIEPCLSMMYTDTNIATWLPLSIITHALKFTLIGTYYTWLNHAHIFVLLNFYSLVHATLKITVYITHNTVAFQQHHLASLNSIDINAFFISIFKVMMPRMIMAHNNNTNSVSSDWQHLLPLSAKNHIVPVI